MARSSLIFFFLLSTQFSFAQNGRYAIYFKDKSGTAYTVNNPIAYLSQKSIDRRIKNEVFITAEDFPVNPDYISQVKATGAEILHASRWMNCALVQLDGNELSAILNLSFVTSAEYIAPPKNFSGGRVKMLKQKNESKLGEANHVQNSMLGLDDMHNENILGEGITIAVFDSGYTGVNITNPFKQLISEARVLLTLDLVGLSDDVFQYDNHGTEVLSVMAAQQSGVYAGGIPKANYQLFVTEDVDTEFRIEEYNWLVAAEKADSAGADIINASLGYNLFDDASMNYTTSQLDGNTTIVSKAAAKALSKGILVVVSAGNDGNTPWKLVDPPADVAGLLAVGSITGTGSLSSFSSLGPTADGRIKPDVVALGSSASVIKVNGSPGITNGTSVSAPLVTSLAAGLMQTFPELTVAELYQLIIASGSMSENPNNQKGYGIPNYLRAKVMLNGGEPPVPTSNVYIYPNPISDILRVLLDVDPGQMASLYVYNLQGSQLMKSEGSVSYVNNPIELDLSGLASGLYILKVEVDGQLKTMRLIKR